MYRIKFEETFINNVVVTKKVIQENPSFLKNHRSF